ncbi:MAG: hypothetical protein ACD_11C00108G0011 [uncultured bacterium]|nr:MAG: hypothetical protein ACD_11C00108G0011 [uncultured bacterium]HBR71417.1 hypothetical protein [Candidatus Moranbacteria bacterium]
MKKERLLINRKKYAFALVEVLLGVALFSLSISALIGTLIYGQESTVLSGDRVRASYLAEEGIEALRNIKDASFSNLTDGTWGLTTTGNQWNLNGSSDANGEFTRQTQISTIDADTKRATTTVSWTQNLQRIGSVVLDTYFTNWQAPVAAASRTMMVYSKSTVIPYYRIWDGSSWEAEGAATSVNNSIQYLVLKFAKNRDEAILGTLDSTGDIRVQVWNGSSWGTTTLLANVGLTNDAYRGFDIDYETSGDRAIVVYNNANAVDPSYRIWNGSSWSSPVVIADPPTSGVPFWIELERNPLSSSNEISMFFSDSNVDVYGMAWNGSTWGTMGTAAVWDATSAVSSKKAIDVAYEQNSGRAMFMWGDSVATDQYYRIWNGTTLTAATLLDIPASGGIANWVELVSRPNSNELMYGVLDAGADLNTRKWSGSAWDTVTQHPEHDAACENITSKNFDIVYETYSGNEAKAWLMWGDGATVSHRQWLGSGWGSITSLETTESDDTSYIKLHANLSTGAVFAGIYQGVISAADDILEHHLSVGGTAWSSKFTIWGGPISAEPVMFRIEMDSER